MENAENKNEVSDKGGFNPKFRDFIISNPDKTLLGMFWSMYWRFALVVAGISFVFGLLAGLIG